MSQNRRNYRREEYNKRNISGRRASYGRTDSQEAEGIYVYGNIVRKLEPQWQLEEEQIRQPRSEVRKNREKAHHMSAGYLLFLGVALAAAALILVNYIQLQAELTNLTKAVATKESELNTLKVDNDEEYNRIVSSINLEEIKRIAMGELGMVYAEEGQIVSYANESNDYMRQVTEVQREGK